VFFDMDFQPKKKPQQSTTIFADGRAMRPEADWSSIAAAACCMCAIIAYSSTQHLARANVIEDLVLLFRLR
jgi:hypothetical protein